MAIPVPIPRELLPPLVPPLPGTARVLRFEGRAAVLSATYAIVMFSILAMNLFGNVSRGSYLHDRANFETFGSSMLTGRPL